MAGAIVLQVPGQTAVVRSVAAGAQGPPGPATAPGTAGQFYVTNAGATAPAWATISGDATASAVTVGQFTVTGWQGKALDAVTMGAPTDAQLPLWVNASSKWKSISISGDATVTAAGVLTVTTQAALKLCTLETFQPTAGTGNATTDQAAFSAAMTALGAGTYGALQLGAKTYQVTGGTLPAGTCIMGLGDGSVLQTVTNGPVITIGGQGCRVARLKIVGNNTGANQDGIRNGVVGGAPGSGFEDLFITEVVFTNLTKGFNTNQYTTLSHRGPNVENCRSSGCGTGFYIGKFAEYMRMVTCESHADTNGIYLEAGNCQFSCCSVSDATGIGVEVVGGSNDGHGMFSNCTFNHTGTVAVQVDNTSGFGVSHGMPFIGCNIFGGNLNLIASNGIRFIGCSIDMDAYTFNGSRGTVFDGCLFLGAALNVITNNASGNASTTRWQPNCVDLTGKYPAFIITGDDGTGWTYPVLAALDLPRIPNAAILSTDGAGDVVQIIANPLALPGTQIWLRADLGIATVSGKVSVWNDQSGLGDANRNAVQATAGNRPTYNASNGSFANQPTIHCAGANINLQTGTWSASPPQATGTIMLVASFGAGTTWGIDDVAAGRYAIFNSSGNVELFFSSADTLLTGLADNSATRIFIFDLNNALTRTYVNSQSDLPSTGNPGSAAADGLTIGTAFNGTAPMNGDIAELWISNQRLTAGQKQSLLAYAAARYGVTVTQ